MTKSEYLQKLLGLCESTQCFFGLHNWGYANKDHPIYLMRKFVGGLFSGATRKCFHCGKMQKLYKCGASDTWQWKHIEKR